MIKLQTAALAAFDDKGPHLQTLAESAHARVLLVGLKPGQRLRDHTSPCQVQIQVLSGSCRVVEEGRELPAASMDLLLIPPGRRHRVEADTESLLLVSLTPHPAAARYPAEHRDRIVSRAPHQAL